MTIMLDGDGNVVKCPICKRAIQYDVKTGGYSCGCPNNKKK